MLIIGSGPIVIGQACEFDYSVPRGYFEELSYEIRERVTPKAKVVALHKRRWMHVVAAALVAGIITLSGGQNAYPP